MVVAWITNRLDGLPLALELAAARIKLLPPESMLPRLDSSLRLLVAGARDWPDRLQTLRATIAWSHNLLTQGAQRLLATCSVLRGGANLAQIEAVAQAAALPHRDVLTDLEELLDHSLLRRVDSSQGSRFMMLETIREFAAERLADLPEEHAICEAGVAPTPGRGAQQCSRCHGLVCQ